ASDRGPAAPRPRARHGPAWPPARAAGRARSGRGERHSRGPALPAGPHHFPRLAGTRAVAARRTARGGGVALCARARLSQGGTRAFALDVRPHRVNGWPIIPTRFYTIRTGTRIASNLVQLNVSTK